MGYDINTNYLLGKFRCMPTSLRAMARDLDPLDMVRMGWSSLRFRIKVIFARVPHGRLTAEGRPPLLVTRGSVRLGRVAVSGYIAPAQIGAAAGGALTIGDDVFINQGSTVVAHASITIGSHVHIGDFAAIYDSDFHSVIPGGETRRAPVVIEDGVWIARGACILPGVTIGRGSVVAAASVVTESVPSGVVVAGVPAKVISHFEVPPDTYRD